MRTTAVDLASIVSLSRLFWIWRPSVPRLRPAPSALYRHQYHAGREGPTRYRLASFVVARPDAGRAGPFDRRICKPHFETRKDRVGAGRFRRCLLAIKTRPTLRPFVSFVNYFTTKSTNAHEDGNARDRPHLDLLFESRP